MTNKAAQYDRIAPYFDLFKASDMSDLPLYQKFAHKVGGSVMELACGTGRLAIELAKAGFDVTAVDISPRMLVLLERKA